MFRPLRNAPALGKVIGSVGLMLYLQAVALLNYGSGARCPRGVPCPEKPIRNFLGLGENMPRLNLYLAGCAVIMGLAVWALLRFTRFGLATRAADENEKGASLLGYSPQRLAGLNWVLSAVLAGIVGLLFVGNGSLDTTGYTAAHHPGARRGAARRAHLDPAGHHRRPRPRHVPGRRWSSSPNAPGGRTGCPRPASAS